MSNQKQIAVNIYQLLDNELGRMHQLLTLYLSMPKDTSTTYANVNHNGLGTIYKRMLEMQDIMLKSFETRDELIQEKVAEMAFTGNSDSE